MLQIHTKLSQITQRLSKLPKTEQPTTFLEYYNLLPHCEREPFKIDVKFIMGWSEAQWRNRLYARTEFSRPEILVLGMLSGQQHKI